MTRRMVGLLVLLTFPVHALCVHAQDLTGGSQAVKKLGPVFQVAGVHGPYTYYPLISGVAGNRNGFVVVWASGPGGSGEYLPPSGQRFDSSGERGGTEFPLTARPQESAVGYSISMASDGSFVFAWHEYGNEIFVRRFDSSGAPQGDEISIPGKFPAVSHDAAGGFRVFWTSGRSVLGQWFKRTGTPQGDAFDVSMRPAGPRPRPVAAHHDSTGNFVVVWSRIGGYGKGGVYGRRFNGEGEPEGSEFKLAANRASVAFGDNGRFEVVWAARQSHEILGRQFNALGEPATDPVLIHSWASTAIIGSDPTVSEDEAGNFVVVWDESGAVRVRKLNRSGQPRGEPFELASGFFPAVSSIGEGRFVVTWTGSCTTTTYGICGQRLQSTPR